MASLFARINARLLFDIGAVFRGKTRSRLCLLKAIEHSTASKVSLLIPGQFCVGGQRSGFRAGSSLRSGTREMSDEEGKDGEGEGENGAAGRTVFARPAGFDQELNWYVSLKNDWRVRLYFRNQAEAFAFKNAKPATKDASSPSVDAVSTSGTVPLIFIFALSDGFAVWLHVATGEFLVYRNDTWISPSHPTPAAARNWVVIALAEEKRYRKN